MRLRSRRFLAPLVMVAPSVVLLTLFLLVPLVRLVRTSFTDWNGIDEHSEWVGLANYEQLVSDEAVWAALRHNVVWLGFASIPIAAGLLLAVILQHMAGRSGRIYRTLFFLPYTLPIVVVGLVWKQIYDPVVGSLNALLEAVRLGDLTVPWLGETSTALPALAMAANWTGFGFCMVLFLAGLSGIEPSLYDAARVDGATSIRVFWHVTLPGLANTLNLVIVVVFIATMRVFDIVYVTTEGGPRRSTEVLGTLIFRETFANSEVGYGAAIAVVTSIIIVLFAGSYLMVRERRARA